MATSTFNGNANYYIDVDSAVQSQNFAGNYSIIYWRVLVVKTYGYGFAAWGNTGSSGWADGPNGGNPDLWNAPSIEYDFRNGSMTGTFTMAQGTYRLNHDANGNASYFINGALNLINLGYARADTGWKSAPKFNRATAPAAPTPIALDQIEQTSIRYRFSGNSNGGSPILEWQIGYGTNASSPQFFTSSGGTTVVGALSPGKTFYFWSRGRNAQGWGPWSSRLSAKTIAGARVKVAGVWKEAIPYVRVGGVWKIARPHIRKSGTWRASL